MNERTRLWVASASAAVCLTAGFEGLRPTTYMDPIHILTVCYGETSPKYAKPGATYTATFCRGLLVERLARDYAPSLAACVTAPTTFGQRVALLSFAYNVGTGATCGSSLVRKLNAGDCVGASAEFSRWTRARGRILPGLVTRRSQERSLFEEGCYAREEKA